MTATRAICLGNMGIRAKEYMGYREVAKYINENTPKTLKDLRKTCTDCYHLPDDCPYEDYTVFNVNNALCYLRFNCEKKDYRRAIEELGKTNKELATHLMREVFSE